MGTATLVEILLAIFLPPVGVFLRFGCGEKENLWKFDCMQPEFWIDLLLTILGYIPGIVYAIYVLTI
ncbi:hypothetical protein RHSIM_RhsimUnG0117800 [Rhododendron simsii]|uniref:Uncharacterized protein n=1 Tax=Rhododendron simsii TaxID=118357 RepID=A0A834L4E1_RHOSS|nr:hypothetical protein RHSIM_RhsimUnG0117800 [Rhododendron simsii]